MIEMGIRASPGKNLRMCTLSRTGRNDESAIEAFIISHGRRVAERSSSVTCLKLSSDDGCKARRFGDLFQSSSTTSIFVEIVYLCRSIFNCSNVEDILCIRKGKFLHGYCSLDNTVCTLCRYQADIEIASLGA